MSLYDSLHTPPWSIVYFSIPVIAWALCFAYCHFTFDPNEAYQARNAPLPWYEKLANEWILTILGGGIILALVRDTVLVMFD